MINRYLLTTILFSLLFSASSKAQNEVVIFPSELLVQPFTASTLKPKLGFEFKTNKNELSLNIGNSLDIVHYKLDSRSSISFGADLFTYTLLRSQPNFHFPVDAIDYLFGVNIGYKKIICRNEIGARLRISHISAHFADGHYNKTLGQWRDQREPKVYSREFFELISFLRIANLRVYAGLTYIFSIDPDDIGTDQYQLGFEYFGEKLFGQNWTPYLAYDFRLINLYSYSGNNSIETGIKYGYSKGKGISFYLRYFSGYNIHGEYFDVKENFTSLGFNFDL